MTRRSGAGLSAIGVGVDLEDVGRFADRVDDFKFETSATLFTPEEHGYCRQSASLAPRYAATWCVKEAAVKALSPWVQLDPRRVNVITSEDGKRTLLIDGAPLSALDLAALVSVAHCSTRAVAAVIVLPHARSDDGDNLNIPPHGRC